MPAFRETNVLFLCYSKSTRVHIIEKLCRDIVQIR